MSDTLLLSFVYPTALPFLDDFLRSCVGQSDREFSLLLMNDGVADLPERTGRFSQLAIEIVNAKGTPARIRSEGLKLAAASAMRNLILIDADDWCAPSRVAVCKRELKRHALVANQLVKARSTIEILDPLWSTRLKQNQSVSAEFIRDKNCLGFSNTAFRLELLRGEFPEVGDAIIAYDWLFFTWLLLGGQQAHFTRETSTFYRQHGGNIAGLSHIGKAEIARGLEVKLRHYESLARADEWYAGQALAFRRMSDRIRVDAKFAGTYYDQMTVNIPAETMWWEATKIIGD